MHAAALRALEFDRIVDAVRAFSLTPMGDERLGALEPSTDAAVVAELLASTTQTAQYIAKHGSFALRAHPELLEILGALAVEGRALEAPRLLALAAFLDSVEDTKNAIRRVRRLLPAGRQGGGQRRVVQERDRQNTGHHRPVGRGRGRCEPATAKHS
jgi:dsDNA-specific endonuclease/ATPase MutS2